MINWQDAAFNDPGRFLVAEARNKDNSNWLKRSNPVITRSSSGYGKKMPANYYDDWVSEKSRPWNENGGPARMQGPVQARPALHSYDGPRFRTMGGVENISDVINDPNLRQSSMADRMVNRSTFMGHEESVTSNINRVTEGQLSKLSYSDGPGGRSYSVNGSWMSKEEAKQIMSNRNFVAGLTTVPSPDLNIEAARNADINKILNKGSTRFAGFRSAAYRTAFPEAANELRNKILGETMPGSTKTWGAELLGASADKKAFKTMSKSFAQSFARGGESLLSPSTGKRLAGGLGKIAGNIGIEAAGAGYSIANGASHALLGTSLGNVAVGGAALAGIAYGIGSALGVSRDDASQAARTAKEFLSETRRPNFGRSEIGQSTTYLVQGLNNRRTAR